MDIIESKDFQQSVHTFDELPEKVKRVWIEEWKEPKSKEVLLASWDGNVAIFSFDFIGLGFQVVPSDFPSMPDLRYCSSIVWEYKGEGTIEFILNQRMTDNREESWVDEVAEPLIALSGTPGLEESNEEA